MDPKQKTSVANQRSDEVRFSGGQSSFFSQRFPRTKRLRVLEFVRERVRIDY